MFWTVFRPFHTILCHFTFCHFIFLGISGHFDPFLSVSNILSIVLNILWPFCIISIFQFHFLPISGNFLPLSWCFWNEIYCYELMNSFQTISWYFLILHICCSVFFIILPYQHTNICFILFICQVSVLLSPFLIESASSLSLPLLHCQTIVSKLF